MIQKSSLSARLKSTLALVFACGTLLPFVGNAASVTYDFDTANSLTAPDSPLMINAEKSPFTQAKVGMVGSMGLFCAEYSTAKGAIAEVEPTIKDLKTGSTFKSSIFFKYITPTDTSKNPALAVGFGNNEAVWPEVWKDSHLVDAFYVGIAGNGDLHFRNEVTGKKTETAGFKKTELVDGNWYQLSLAVMLKDAATGQWDLVGEIRNADGSSATVADLVVSSKASFTNPALAKSSVHGFLFSAGAPKKRGIQFADLWTVETL